MYNEQFKLDFIKWRSETNTDIEGKLRPLFEWSAPMEEKYGKDLCNFSMMQILDLYKSRLTDSYSFLVNIHSQLSIYAKYCYSKNMIDDGQNHFLEVDRQALTNCLHNALIETSIISRSELIPIVSGLPNAFEQFIVLGLFEGILGSQYCEFIEAKGSDIDPKTKTIMLYGGRVLPISTELIECGLSAASTYTYFTQSGGQKPFLNDSLDWIIKAKYNAHGDRAKPRTIQLALARLEDATGNPLFRTASLRESGIIDMVYGLLKQNKDMSYKECAVKHKNEIIFRYGTSLYKRMFIDDEYKKFGIE